MSSKIDFKSPISLIRSNDLLCPRWSVTVTTVSFVSVMLQFSACCTASKYN